jgi:endonuclease YncB( thermonuclease family)
MRKLSRNLKVIAMIIGLVFLIANAVSTDDAGPSGRAANDLGKFDGIVSWVADGDTFKLATYAQRIRIWGIDAPEMNIVAGRDAQVFVERLIKGKFLTCRKKDADRYGRIVAQCFIQGQDVAKFLLQNDHAVEYCRYSRGYYGKCY